MVNYSAYIQLLRLHRPAAFALVVLPAFWALIASSAALPDWRTSLIFIAGGMIMRSAGCIINDIFDRDIDTRVERTAVRPLASGALSLSQALALLGLLLAISLMLLWQLSPAARITALLGFPLIVFYPLTKRFFKLPQLFMGLSFALGVPIAYAHTSGQVPAEAIAMYALTALWMLNFDLQYALQDLEDDRKARINSGALLLGAKTPAVTAGLHLVLVAGWALWAYWQNYAWSFYPLLSLAGACFAYQYFLLQRQQYYRAFSNNQYFAVILLLAFIAEIQL